MFTKYLYTIVRLNPSGFSAPGTWHLAEDPLFSMQEHITLFLHKPKCLSWYIKLLRELSAHAKNLKYHEYNALKAIK